MNIAAVPSGDDALAYTPTLFPVDLSALASIPRPSSAPLLARTDVAPSPVVLSVAARLYFPFALSAGCKLLLVALSALFEPKRTSVFTKHWEGLHTGPGVGVVPPVVPD